VPCFVRRQFNNLVGNIFFVITSDEVKYKFHVKKGSSKTRVFGSGYQKFLHDYDLKVGDCIMFGFDNAPELFGILQKVLMALKSIVSMVILFYPLPCVAHFFNITDVISPLFLFFY
jgi:hypothetical protein